MRSVLVTLAFLAVACDDFELVSPQAGVQPHLSLHMFASHAERLVYSASGFLETGTDSEGLPRQLSDSAMTVQGHVIQPRIVGEALIYEWGDTLAASDLSPESVSILTPAFAGQSTASRVISLPITTRADPFHVDLAMGESLRLRLSAPAATPLVVQSAEWLLHLQKGDATILSVSGEGTVGREVTVPWTWLEQNVAAGDTIAATLLVLSSYDAPVGPLPVSPVASSLLTWRVRIGASAPLP